MIEERRKARGLTQAEVGMLAFGKADNSAFQNLRRGAMPSVDKLAALAEALGLEFYIGPGREDSAGHADGQADPEIMPGQVLPLVGMANCSVQGWAEDDRDRAPIARPAWVSDDNAFWVNAAGQSMQPEGIRSGDYCLVSPARRPRPGDRVWIREAGSDRASIKRLVEQRPGHVRLRGWLPVEAGQQRSFDEQRFDGAVDEMFPVIGVYRGRLGKTGIKARLIPDPKDESARPGAATSSLPETWLRGLGLRSGVLRQVIVSDDTMAPDIPSGAVVLIDESDKDIAVPGVFVLRFEGRELLRRLETVGEAIVISAGHPGEATLIIAAHERAGVEILGRAIWVGHRLE